MLRDFGEFGPEAGPIGRLEAWSGAGEELAVVGFDEMGGRGRGQCGPADGGRGMAEELGEGLGEDKSPLID